MTDKADTLLGPYSESVRAAFRNPRHAGEPRSGGGQRFESHASESRQGAQVMLVAIVDDNTLVAMRYRVFGCPHLLAATEVCCERFEGGRVNKLTKFSVSQLMETLGVPVEKTGRILVLENAIRSLRSQIDGIATNET